MYSTNSITRVTSDDPIDGQKHGSAYYPIIDYQVSNLVGQVMTQLEVTALNEVQLKALKSIFNQLLYGWFEEVKDNSRTAGVKYLHPFWIVDGDIVYAKSIDKLSK